MKKRLICALSFAVLMCGTSQVLAGPFADVPAKHWAYNAINQLAKDGIIDGYGDGTYHGDKTLTRYEMAVMVGKAIEQIDKANNNDKKLIDNLSIEFNKELATFGVRMTTVENKVNDLEKVKISGDFFLRGLAFKDTIKDAVGTTKDKDTFWRTRIRLNIDDKIDENTSAFVRFGIRDTFGSAGVTTRDWQSDKTASYQALDQYGITYSSNGISYKLGRQGVVLGQGLLLCTGDDAQWDNRFDGLTASGKIGAFDTSVVVGTTTKSAALDYYGDTRATWYGVDVKTKLADKLSVGASYVSHQFEPLGTSPYKGLAGNKNMVAANLSYSGVSNFIINGEYAKSSAATDNKAYVVGATYLMGKDSLTASYVNVQRYSVDPYNTLYSAIVPFIDGVGINLDTSHAPVARDWNGWMYYYKHPISKTTFLDLYVVDGKSKGLEGHDLEGFMGLNVKFN
ncbi:S-layer homology domain-containing protein [Sporomusa sp. KB1]|jgi:hypothetical protein|uniref:S-layer homology domain-containing protein n=1 Tax=Sporomusa sp. KB1 TaxID=943346 RepID=UPI00119FCE9A|nr:S-layer homology domain-containing protein [Sporomusa sp. KB1]TWH51962.1 S-layer family protein [Sporomusa sp. KB1]